MAKLNIGRIKEVQKILSDNAIIKDGVVIIPEEVFNRINEKPAMFNGDKFMKKFEEE